MASGQPGDDARRREKPGFKDVRQGREHARAQSADRVQALEALRKEVPGVQVEFDPVTGAPSYVQATGKFLTGPAPDGKTPREVVEDYIDHNKALFGHDASALHSARVTREDVTQNSGITTLVWNQEVNGIPVFKTILKANLTGDGRIVTIDDHFAASPVANRAEPALNAERAIALAAASLSDTVPESRIQARTEAEGAEQLRRYTAPGQSDTIAQLTYLPMNSRDVRLGWDVTTMSLAQNEMFRVVVDAENGEVLYRTSLTDDATDATFRVYADATTKVPLESPAPMKPANSVPGSLQGVEVPRALITLQSVNATASPNGWINDGGQETLGNNVDAHTDFDASSNSPDLPRPNGGASRTFDFAVDLTQAPSSYANAAVTHLFYLNNWIHDQLYGYGFTEASGNFQTDNFGRGGSGNDAVQADAQDGSGTNNANMSTPADGSAPRMQMYVFTGPTPDRDGDFDDVIVIHEYVHGLSNRLVGGGVGMSALASRGMGEGWSDFYGMALLASPDSDPNAVYAGGSYATLLFTSGMTNNYYFGIRRYPYTTDMLKNPLTFKDIDPTQASPHTGIPLSPLFSSSNSNPSEVHNSGEVWCMMLWECRAKLIDKHGGVVGNQRILQYVTDGMKLAPVNPNFLQSRDSVIQAAQVSHPEDVGELWAAFAKRGAGFGATAPASSSTTGVVESYAVPNGLQVDDLSGWTITGNKGGPFTPASKVLTLSNTSGASINWTGASTATWLNISPASGTVTAGGTQTVTITTQANALVSGFYSTDVVFTNATTSSNIPIAVRLDVTPPLVQSFALNSDPGWTRTGEWAFGAPTGGGGAAGGGTGNPDPTSGATGTNVFGVNLSGNQSTTVGGPYYLTTGAINLGVYKNTRLRFKRWLNTNSLANTRSTVEVSTNGTTWREVFVNPASAITDSAWQSQDYDLAQVADLSPTVYVRWGYRVIAGSSAYSGWNIDDVEILGEPTNALMIASADSAAEGGASVTATLSVTLLQAADTVVTLTSSDPTAATVPSTVTIPAGMTSTTFAITPVDDALADGPQVTIITASAGGLPADGTKLFTVQDNESATLTLSLPASVSEGGANVQGTVTRSDVNASPVTVTLVSGNPADLTVPLTVVIPGGQASANFMIAAVNDTRIDGTQNVTVSASVVGWTGASASMDVLDNEPLTLAVTLPASVTEGATGTGSVALTGTLTVPLVVNLSSNQAKLTVPATVTIPAGSVSATFTVTAPNDTFSDANVIATVTASTAGFTNGSSTMPVIDNDVHHFVFTTIASPKTLNAAFSITITAQNQSNNTVTAFTGTAGLSGTGASGAITLTPTTTTAFTAGVWTGSITISTATTNIVLTANDGAGHAGSSNSFTVGVGALDHFVWSTITSPKTAGTPFSSTITAKDIANNTVTSFVSTAALSGLGSAAGTPRAVGAGTSSTTTLPLYTYYEDQRSQCIYLQSEIGAATVIRGLTLNVTTLPGQTMNNWTIRMKHTALSSYSTAAWESTGWTTVYQANTTVSALGPTTFTFTMPFAYNGTSNLMVDFSFNNSSWTSAGGVTYTAASATRAIHYYTDSFYGDPLTWSGTSSPTPFTTTVLPNLVLQTGTTFPVTPSTTTAFTSGVWTGNVTVNQTGTQQALHATSGTAIGDSNLFDVTSTVLASPQSVNVTYNTPAAITLTGQDTANPGAALTYTNVTNPTNGVLSGTGANRAYTPNLNYSGPDSFTFTAANGAIVSVPATVSITVLQAPGEIAIEQPVGTDLIDGVSTVNYGSIPIVSGTTRTFTVRNVGATSLVISGVAKDGTDSADITLGSISASTIAGGSSATFDVTFAPAALGARSAAIHVLSNDVDEGSFDIALEATGSAAFPEIAIEQPAGTLRPDNAAIVDFGPSQLGAPVTQTFTIKNTGGADLSVSGVTIDGAGGNQFSAGAPSSSLIAPAGSATLVVTFTPTTPGAKLATLHVLCNDPDEGSYDIEMQGIGTVVPGPVALTRDINSQPSGSALSNFVASGSNYFYQYSLSIYRTNGTAAGTSLISGYSSTAPSMAAIGSTLFFGQTDSTAGTELWTYNGTTSARLADINPGTANSIPGNFTVVGSTLFFTATTAANGLELWKSDGTAVGTVLVKDIAAGTTSSSPANLAAVGSTLYFTANDGTNGVELWKSDGSSAGTVMVANINAGSASSSPANLTAVGSNLFFTATNNTTGIELYKSDGTTTVIVLDIYTGSTSSSPAALFNWGGTLYFRATTSAAGTELWKSDGTAGGTVLVKDIFSGTSSSTPASFAVAGSALYFSATDSTANGTELWKTDGTSGGTVMVANINATASGSSFPAALTTVGSSLFFYANDGVAGAELWRSDGTGPGTVRVEDINLGTGSSGITVMANLSGVALFGATDGITGTELWRSDGTAAGTFRVTDALAGNVTSAPGASVALGSSVLFAANDGVNGVELWKSDGTPGGTVLLKDISTTLGASSSPSNFTPIGATLFFTATDPTNGMELWKTDGTSAGTMLVKDIFTGTSSSSPVQFRAMGGMLYFAATDTTANGQELWKSDGTAAGTVMVKNINASANSSSLVTSPVVAGDLLYFSASDGTNGSELWVSDGTSAGTVMVKDINPTAGSGSSISNLTPVGSVVFFKATDGVNGQELWKSDGTAAGTVMVKDILAGAGNSNAANFFAYDGLLYFAASDLDFANQTELWRSDGTTAGTYVLVDINPGIASSTPSNFREHNGVLYFSATDSFGTELWRTDGTVPGTFQVKDLNPGSSSSSPSNLFSAGGQLYFSATTSANGTELWRTDGTAAGTQLVADINLGAGSSSPNSFVLAGSRLFFNAAVTGIGTEVFSYDLGTVPEIAFYEGSGTAGSERQDNVGTFDFGTLSVPATSSFTIKNTGTGYLFVSDIVMGGPQADSFTVVGKPDPSLAIQPGATHTFSVIATLEGPVFQSAVLSILCNDADEPSFDMPVTVIVDDTEAPVISAPATYLIGQPGQLAMSLSDVRGIVIYSDNRIGDGTITQNPIPGDLVLAIGQSVVVSFTATDSVGNVSNTVTTTVTMGLGQPNTGDLVWARSGAGVGNEGAITRVAAAPDGGAYVAGTFASSPFTLGSGVDQVTLTSAGSTDVFIARFAKDGTLLWARSGGGTGAESAQALAVLSDGSVAVAGSIGLTATFSGVTLTATTTDGFVARYLADGTLSWLKAVAGTGTDTVTQLVQLGDGNLAIAGSFTTTTTLTVATGATVTNIGATATDLFFAKLDKNVGTGLWARAAGSSTLSESTTGLTLVALPDGGLGVAGTFLSATLSFTGSATTLTNTAGASNDWWAAKYDATGALLWATNVGGGTGTDSVSALRSLSTGDMVIAGTTASATSTFGAGQPAQQVFANLGGTTTDVVLARVSGANGALQWARRAGGVSTDAASALAVLPDDSLVLTGIFQAGSMQLGIGEAGATTLSTASASSKVYLARFNSSNGTLRWAKCTSGLASEGIGGLTVLWDGDLGVVGTFATPSSVFGPGEANATTLVNSGTTSTTDVFFAKFNRVDGSLVWAKSGGGVASDVVHGAATLANGSAIVVGSYQPVSATFGFGEANATTLANADTGGTNTDLFFARFNAGGAEPPAAPVVTLLPASGLSPSTMTFNTSIDTRGQDTTVLIDYGPTTSYGTTVSAADAPAGLVPATRSVSLTALAPLTTMHFRVRATNNEGTTTSSDQTITTFADAEISVEQPAGASLIDGVSTVSFGVVPVGSSQTNTFTILNSGTATATLTGLAINKIGAAAADYTLGSLGATSLAPGASTTFDVTYTPSAGGARAAAIQIGSNDGDENPFDIALTGNNFVDAAFNNAADIPITAAGYTVPAGRSLNVTLGFAPPPGTALVLVSNTATTPISGAFLDLPQGGLITAIFGGQTYIFQANYFGGDGNDLVLVESFDWMWTKGHNNSPVGGTSNGLGVFGPTTTPTGRGSTMTWTDAAGTMWIFGGISSGSTGLNDMWKYDRSLGQWAFMKGTPFSGTNGVYGTLGTPAATNLPGARYGGITWTDTSGRLWLFGGMGLGASGSTYGQLNDLWRFDPATANWTWLGGSTATLANGTYGTQGTPSTSNIPGARFNGAAAADPTTGMVWLFGGLGLPATGTTTGSLNDLWRYNPTTGEWTWMKGGSVISAYGAYGTKGTAAAANTPGTRYGFGLWFDVQGRLWVFGGIGYGTNISGGYLGDLWKYDSAANMWTWMSGSGTSVAGPYYSGTYGTQARPAATNAPGFRMSPATWTDTQGRLWMHGGLGYGSQNLAVADLSDLWFYDTALNQWAWVKGPQTVQNNGVYGTQGTPSVTNLPGAREQASAFAGSGAASNLWLFGGLGYLATGTSSIRLNDVWTLDLPDVPVVTTLAASSVTDVSVTLNASGTANGTAASVRFLVSTAANLAGATPTAVQSIGLGSSTVAVNLPVASLAPATTYYFAAEVFSNSGHAIGATLSFTTTSALNNWRQLYFGTTSNSGDAADDADPENDGIKNLMEFALGTNPTIASNTLLPVVSDAVKAADGKHYFTVSYRRRIVPGALTYSLQSSPDLTTWTTVGGASLEQVGAPVATGDGVTEVVSFRLLPSINDSPAPRFVRLSVTD